MTQSFLDDSYTHPHGFIPLEDEYYFTSMPDSTITPDSACKPSDTNASHNAATPHASSVHNNTCAHNAQFYAFNTAVTINVYADTETAKTACSHAFEACRAFEYLFSRTIESSDISRIHEHAPHWTDIHPVTYALLHESITYCHQSLNTFDITMGGVCKLWDFSRKIIPSHDDITCALSHVNIDALELSCNTNTYRARLNDPNARLDVGGTAKGFIADRIGDILLGYGIHHFLINLGGNVLVHGGKPSGAPFIVGIKNPQDPNHVLMKIPLHSGSVVTSGLYERAFTYKGTRYAHILSPKTGMPITTDAESVTVIAPKSADCDGYSTTLCALGIQKGIAFAQQCPAITCAIFIDNTNTLYMSNPEALA